MYKRILKAIGCILLCESAGLIGTIFTVSAIPTWYATLNRPPLNPPAWLFGPVWITLYALMGIALFLVWQKKKKSNAVQVQIAINIFLSQLMLNAAWSIIFFGLHAIGYALIDIIALLFFIVLTMIKFSKISKPAMWLLVPYLVWVSFATYLNIGFWWLN